MKKRILAWSDTLGMVAVKNRLVMLTLTYADGSTWRPDQLSDYMNKLSKLLGSKLLTYCCIAELQTRGDIHYHVELVVKPGTDVPRPDESGMWVHGSSNRVTWCGVYYLVEYARKSSQKGLGDYGYPPGARIMSMSIRHLALLVNEAAQVARRTLKRSMMPAWLLALADQGSCDVLSVHRTPEGWMIGDHAVKSSWTLVGIAWREVLVCYR